MNLERINKSNLAYVIGIAIGDGNLSNPNNRATRLRITCDLKYKNLIKRIIFAIQKVLPENKVSLVKRKGRCIDISCYSNKLEKLLGWKANCGPKYKQNISIPRWIKRNKKFIPFCLKGLFETDGSIYFDRKYKMANFTTIIPRLASEVADMILKLNFDTDTQVSKNNNKKPKYTIRVYKNIDKFLKIVRINKT